MEYNNNYKGEGLIPIESIIYGGYVKMTRLQGEVYKTYSNSPIASATELNIFIDVYSILHQLFSETYRTDIRDYTAITSGLINMCAHYRNFFGKWSGLGVSTKFYLVFSFNTCDINRKFVANYNETFYNKSQIPEFFELAKNNFDLLSILCPYLPDIFFVQSPRNYESAVVIANLIETINDGNPNLIISKDLYPIQLCYLYPFTSYLYPIKKRGGGDESVMLPIREKACFREEFWKFFADRRKVKPESFIDLSPLNYPLLSAMSRFPERNIMGSLNIHVASNYIRSIVGNSDIKILSEQLYQDGNISSKLPVADIDSKYKTLDVQFMLPYYKQDPESQAIKLQNLDDPNTLNMINAKFFANNPLDFSKL
jgi:hypothetical protein